MIHAVTRKSIDEQHIGRTHASVGYGVHAWGSRSMIKSGVHSTPYEDVIVKKPWGYEYLVFENEHVAIWMLQIVRKRRTSMHCHPRKRTGLILLSGDAKFHHLEGNIPLGRMSVVNIDPGTFHSTEAASMLPIDPVSENGIWVMEIESPPLKEDLCRMSDAYGRAGATYEGADHMVPQPKEILRLQEPEDGESKWHGTFQNLIFTVRKGAVRGDRGLAGPESLVAVIAREPGKEYANPFMEVGKVFSLQEFREHTKDEDFEGVTVLTIEQEKKVVKISDYIASTIADLGVRHVFGVCGGGAMHLVDSFGGSDRLEYIATHHEQAAAMAAEGYARISGVPGATLVTSGPGGTNAITGVYGAWVDSIPAIFVSGQVTRDTLIGQTGLRQFGIQEGNIIDVVRPITKYAVAITDPQTIRYHVEKACHLATTGRPGPVWIDVPLDVQNKLINPEELPGYTPEEPSQPCTPHTLNGLVSECREMLTGATRPVLIFGYGVRLSGAEDSLRDLVQRLRIPCVSSWTASDIIPTADENHVGRSGIMGDRAGNFAVQNADLVLIVGSRMSIPQVGYNYKLFARAAKKIMVDIDEIELKKPSLRPDLPICADAGEFLHSLLARVEADGITLAIDDWRTRCKGWKEKYPVCLPEYRDNRDKVNSFYFVDRLSEKTRRGRRRGHGHGHQLHLHHANVPHQGRPAAVHFQRLFFDGVRAARRDRGLLRPGPAQDHPHHGRRRPPDEHPGASDRRPQQAPADHLRAQQRRLSHDQADAAEPLRAVHRLGPVERADLPGHRETGGGVRHGGRAHRGPGDAGPAIGRGPRPSGPVRLRDHDAAGAGVDSEGLVAQAARRPDRFQAHGGPVSLPGPRGIPRRI